jgi:hypothetical protein
LKLARFGPLLALVLVAGILRAPTLRGPGYALDEEITVFAVRGIQRVGLPLFPSGVLNDRGMPFSYAAWIAGLFLGQGLPAYRVVSLLFGIATVVALYLTARRAVGLIPAFCASLLLAIFPLHVAVSGWARFYALAAAGFIVSVALFFASDTRPRVQRWFAASVAFSVLLQELCIVLVALPLLAAAARADDGEDVTFWTRGLIVCAACVFSARLAIVGLHFLAPDQRLNPWLHQGASVAAPSRAPWPFPAWR